MRQPEVQNSKLRIRRLLAIRRRAWLLIGLGLLACTPEPAATPRQVAMHVDAVFKFAIEHPRAWVKQTEPGERRYEGVVRWTQADAASPAAAAELVVRSDWNPAEADDKGAFLRALQQSYPGFEISHRDPVELPAGKSLRILGYTPQRIYSIHILNTARRRFTILFSAPTETFAGFEKLLDDMLESFVLLEPDESARPD